MATTSPSSALPAAWRRSSAGAARRSATASSRPHQVGRRSAAQRAESAAPPRSSSPPDSTAPPGERGGGGGGGGEGRAQMRMPLCRTVSRDVRAVQPPPSFRASTASRNGSRSNTARRRGGGGGKSGAPAPAPASAPPASASPKSALTWSSRPLHSPPPSPPVSTALGASGSVSNEKETCVWTTPPPPHAQPGSGLRSSKPCSWRHSLSWWAPSSASAATGSGYGLHRPVEVSVPFSASHTWGHILRVSRAGRACYPLSLLALACVDRRSEVHAVDLGGAQPRQRTPDAHCTRHAQR
eukprot:scaffold31696_cov63-Phaeocystis_antarctica.AAC.1